MLIVGFRIELVNLITTAEIHDHGSQSGDIEQSCLLILLYVYVDQHYVTMQNKQSCLVSSVHYLSLCDACVGGGSELSPYG